MKIQSLQYSLSPALTPCCSPAMQRERERERVGERDGERESALREIWGPPFQAQRRLACVKSIHICAFVRLCLKVGETEMAIDREREREREDECVHVSPFIYETKRYTGELYNSVYMTCVWEHIYLGPKNKYPAKHRVDSLVSRRRRFHLWKINARSSGELLCAIPHQLCNVFPLWRENTLGLFSLLVVVRLSIYPALS